MGAERAAITVETLIAEAEAARSKAMREKRRRQWLAAAAITAMPAKLAVAYGGGAKGGADLIRPAQQCATLTPSPTVPQGPRSGYESGAASERPLTAWGGVVSRAHLRSLQRDVRGVPHGNCPRRCRPRIPVPLRHPMTPRPVQHGGRVDSKPCSFAVSASRESRLRRSPLHGETRHHRSLPAASTARSLAGGRPHPADRLR